MKGDVIVVEEYHRQAARSLIPKLSVAIVTTNRPITISVAGESGSGKSELAKAIAEEFAEQDILFLILGQDDYFRLPPKSNDRRRREDPTWLGPQAEVNLALLDDHLRLVKEGAAKIEKPLISYNEDKVENVEVDLSGVKGVIAEGTYTSLLREADIRIFILRNRVETLEHRTKRNRGNEVGDPFIEDVLKIEHKIIAGHQNLADFLISKDFQLIGSD